MHSISLSATPSLQVSPCPQHQYIKIFSSVLSPSITLGYQNIVEINILEDAFHCYNCFLNQIDALDCIFIRVFLYKRDFPGSSAGKESTCNAEDPGSIPRLGRSAGERIGYPLQSAWASLVAQLVKNPPAMRETRVQSLGWEDPLEKGMATHSSILALRIGQQRVGHD